MSKRKIAIGPGAASLILIVVMLSLCMLAMLMQIGSRNDYNLTRRSADMISRVYEVSSQSEERLAELDAILIQCRTEHNDMESYLAAIEEKLTGDYAVFAIWDDEITWTEQLDQRTLTCTVKILPPGEKQRTKWITHKLTAEAAEVEFEDGNT